MERTRRTTDRCRLPSLPPLLAAAILLGPALATNAAAQSDAGTVNASVTVETDAITVTGVQDLLFGTHFATEGIVPNEQAAAWQIDVSTDPTNVDLALTVLPTELVHASLPDAVPLFYGPDSFSASCAGVLVTAEPVVGISSCDVSPGFGFAFLGDDPTLLLGTSPVEADLSAAPPGTYTATVELTATIN
jgi:hypothetical protein